MKSALKAVLGKMTVRERATLALIVDKVADVNNAGSFHCPRDCDKNLARINLCPHCQLEERLIAPILDALKELKQDCEMKKTPSSGN